MSNAFPLTQVVWLEIIFRLPRSLLNTPDTYKHAQSYCSTADHKSSSVQSAFLVSMAPKKKYIDDTGSEAATSSRTGCVELPTEELRIKFSLPVTYRIKYCKLCSKSSLSPSEIGTDRA